MAQKNSAINRKPYFKGHSKLLKLKLPNSQTCINKLKLDLVYSFWKHPFISVL